MTILTGKTTVLSNKYVQVRFLVDLAIVEVE